MQTQTQLEHDRLVEQKLQKLRNLYADAPEIGKAAMKNGLSMITEELAAAGRAAAPFPSTFSKCPRARNW